jgi:uncharacterized Zn-finger protein
VGEQKNKEDREMDELIKLLDKNLEYICHETNSDAIHIWVQSACGEAACPYCGRASNSAHSHYERGFRDFAHTGQKSRNRHSEQEIALRQSRMRTQDIRRIVRLSAVQGEA